jgi:hypothetical protein
MESKNITFVSNYKKIGFTRFDQNDLQLINGDRKFLQSSIR